MRLSAVEVKVLEKLVQYLQNPKATSVNLTAEQVDVLTKRILSWSESHRFPGTVLQIKYDHL
jgi:hypothetical protein